MAYSLAEAVWLVEQGASDVLVAYPSVDRESFRRIGADEQPRARDHRDDRRSRSTSR